MSTTDSHRIRQVLFKLDRNTNYKFDVNHTTTIKGIKRIITTAANLGKAGLKIFHNGVEYTDEDDSTLAELFPDQQLTEFTITISAPPVYDNESRIKLKLGHYCLNHVGKYLYFYCYDCAESICSSCTISMSHKGHNIIEKYDYLQSSKHLVDVVFSDMTNFISGVKLDKKSDSEELKNKIKIVYFPRLHEMLNGIENKMIDLVDTMREISEKSYFNLKQNADLIKDHCSQGLDKLKEEIHIEDIMMNQEIFIIFDRKYKDIENEKNRIKEDKKKFEELNESFKIVTETIEKVHHQIYSFLDENNKSTVLTDLKNSSIKDKAIELVNKEQIFDKILSDVNLRKTGKKSVLERAAKSTAPNYAFSSLIRDISPLREPNNFDNLLLESIFNYNKEPDNSRKVNSSLTPPVEARQIPSEIRARISSEPEIPIPVPSSINQISNQYIDNKIIMRVDPGSSDIIYYDDQTSELGRIPIKFSPFSKIPNFLSNCSWINHNQKLYITGGQLDPDTASDSFLCYDYMLDKLSILPDMLQGRFSHSMICNNNAIYAVGGYKSNACEKFDLGTMKWTKLNSLILEERQNSILYVHNNYLYCFFGYMIGSYLDTVEKLKLTNNKAKWETVPYKNLDKIDLKLIGCGIVRYVDHSVIFLGGRNSNEQRLKAFKFDFSTSTATSTEIVLEDHTYFQESTLEELGPGCYGHFDNENGDNFLKISVSK